MQDTKLDYLLANKNNLDLTRHWGLCTSVDVKNCDPQLIRSTETIKEYVEKLCDLIEMKRFGETQVVHFGDHCDKVAGYSMVQLIETSLISGHFANATNSAYIDVFSCKGYDPYMVINFTQKFFNGSHCAINIFHRS